MREAGRLPWRPQISGLVFLATARCGAVQATASGCPAGQVRVVLDLAHMLIIDLFPCEDGHAQKRAILPEVLDVVQSAEQWVSDRNFCTTDFLFGIAARRACFQPQSRLHWPVCGYLGRVLSQRSAPRDPPGHLPPAEQRPNPVPLLIGKIDGIPCLLFLSMESGRDHLQILFGKCGLVGGRMDTRMPSYPRPGRR